SRPHARAAAIEAITTRLRSTLCISCLLWIVRRGQTRSNTARVHTLRTFEQEAIRATAGRIGLSRRDERLDREHLSLLFERSVRGARSDAFELAERGGRIACAERLPYLA